MATYVLMHGGWAGGWILREVAAHLQATGHTVFRPTLTGAVEQVELVSLHRGRQPVGNQAGTISIDDVIRLQFVQQGLRNKLAARCGFGCAIRGICLDIVSARGLHSPKQNTLYQLLC